MKHFQPEIVSISNRFIVLGGAPPSAHMFPGARFDAGIGSRCAGIIVLGHIEPTELAAVLEAAPDPGIPIADFADTPGIHRDYIGQSFDPQSFSELRRRFAPIWRCISDAPFRARPEQRTELAILRRAYTRQAPVEAALPRGHAVLSSTRCWLRFWLRGGTWRLSPSFIYCGAGTSCARIPAANAAPPD